MTVEKEEPRTHWESTSNSSSTKKEVGLFPQGMLEWEDITVSARFRLLATGASGCVATRMDRFLEAGVMLCVNTTGEWTLSYGNPNEAANAPIKGLIARGRTTTPQQPIALGSWHRLSLTTIKNASSGWYDGAALFSEQTIRTIDTVQTKRSLISKFCMKCRSKVFQDRRYALLGNIE